MRPSPVRLFVLATLAAACGGPATCPEASEDVERTDMVGGVTPVALFEWVDHADQSIAFTWTDGQETALHGMLSIGRDTGRAVNSPMCIEECVAHPEDIPVDACGPDWLITHAAAVLWTDDGRLQGEALVGRALAMGQQWRLDLVPARGSTLQGSLQPSQLVDFPADTVEWQLNATLLGGQDSLLAAEVRLKSHQSVGGEDSTQTQRLGVTPGVSGGGD